MRRPARRERSLGGQRPRAVRARRALAGLVLVAFAFGVAGCTSPRNALGTSTGRCYVALPVARAALRAKGRFTGVRYVTLGAFARALEAMRPPVVDVPRRASRSRAAVCVVAYRGRFAAADVERGWAVDSPTGRYALVAVRVPQERLVATVVLEKAPIRFSRLFAVGR